MNIAVADFEELEGESDDNDDDSTRDEGSGEAHHQLAKVIRNVVLVSIEGQNQRERLLDICRDADQGEPT